MGCSPFRRMVYGFIHSRSDRAHGCDGLLLWSEVTGNRFPAAMNNVLRLHANPLQRWLGRSGVVGILGLVSLLQAHLRQARCHCTVCG